MEFFEIARGTLISVEILAAFAAVFYIKKISNTPVIYYAISLWLTIMLEAIAFYLIQIGDRNNSLLYNCYYIVNFSILFFFYHELIENQKLRIWIKVFFILFLLSFLYSAVYKVDFRTETQNFPVITASIFLVITIIFYFNNILRADKIFRLSRSMVFWISLGLLIFYIGNIPLRAGVIFLVQKEVITIFLIKVFLAITLYSCVLIGFIWGQKE